MQLLCQCIEEVGFDWSIQTGDVITARRHLCRLQSLDKESALLRSVHIHLLYRRILVILKFLDILRSEHSTSNRHLY